jgi:hypothetical protein
MRGVLLCALAGSLPAGSTPAQAPSAIPIARIAYVDDLVEVQPAGKAWSKVPEGAQLRIGDKLRTGPRGTARIDFPWMSVAVAGASLVSVPASLVLATVLEEGRVEQTSPSGEMIKLLTAEARIRGEGKLAVRRERGRTLVSAFAGSFRIEAGGKVLSLSAGYGTIVEKGGARPPVELPQAPVELDPGDDPLYVAPNETITLRFSSPARAHHLQVLGIDSSQILIERDLASGPTTIAIPWQGTFRWRVAARDAAGLEGPPSREGLVAVVSK